MLFKSADVQLGSIPLPGPLGRIRELQSDHRGQGCVFTKITMFQIQGVHGFYG